MNDLSEKIFQAIGEASMCWGETPKGEFDSTKAKEIGEQLLKDIQSFPSEGEVASAAYQHRRDYQDKTAARKGGMNECIMNDAIRKEKSFKKGVSWHQSQIK